MKAKKIFKIVVIALAVLFVGFYGVRLVKKIQKNYQIARSRGAMPQFRFTTLDHHPFTKQSLSDSLGTVIFELYAPGCSHCQNMAKSFAANQDRIKNMEILMVTPYSDSAEVEAFIKEYNLESLPNTRFLLDPERQFFNIFGLTGTPYFYIYKDNVLKKVVRGEADVKEVLD